LCRLNVAFVYVRGERAVCAFNVVSVDSSAELATSIEDKPGRGVSDLPGLVTTFFSFPESRRVWLTWHSSRILLMWLRVV
jgi:hypothetical protein